MKHSRAMAIATLFLTGAAWAGPSCHEPETRWMSEPDFKAKIQQQGYQIKTFKISKGKCYEIYGFDQSGKKVEIYFNPVSGAELERK
ncbi:MAG: hypothetical protein RL111_513 [Pseudomonadota bacterium]|jgi:hypothetical protein